MQKQKIEFLGIWEQIHNPNFNYGEFAIIRSNAGLNSYKISVKEWTERTKKLANMQEEYVHNIILAVTLSQMLGIVWK